MREEIGFNKSTMDCLVAMAEGNPGAITVLSEILQKDPHGLITVLHLDDMNIRGPQIWVGYKDFCGQDIHKFIECVKNRDGEMIDAINNEMRMDKNWNEWAVTSGGSARKNNIMPPPRDFIAMNNKSRWEW